MSEITNKYERTIDGVTYDVVETMTPKAPPTPEPMYPKPDAYMRQRWERVEYGAVYWCIDSDGSILRCNDYHNDASDALYANGNYYRSEREAEHARDTQVLMNQIQRWRDCHDPVVLDWSDCNQDKYMFWYDHHLKRVLSTFFFVSQTLNATYFSSCDLAKQCLAATEEDYTQTYGERLKALFEVK